MKNQFNILIQRLSIISRLFSYYKKKNKLIVSSVKIDSFLAFSEYILDQFPNDLQINKKFVRDFVSTFKGKNSCDEFFDAYKSKMISSNNIESNQLKEVVSPREINYIYEGLKSNLNEKTRFQDLNEIKVLVEILNSVVVPNGVWAYRITSIFRTLLRKSKTSEKSDNIGIEESVLNQKIGYELLEYYFHSIIDVKLDYTKFEQVFSLLADLVIDNAIIKDEKRISVIQQKFQSYFDMKLPFAPNRILISSFIYLYINTYKKKQEEAYQKFSDFLVKFKEKFKDVEILQETIEKHLLFFQIASSKDIKKKFYQMFFNFDKTYKKIVEEDLSILTTGIGSIFTDCLTKLEGNNNEERRFTKIVKQINENKKISYLVNSKFICPFENHNLPLFDAKSFEESKLTLFHDLKSKLRLTKINKSLFSDTDNIQNIDFTEKTKEVAYFIQNQGYMINQIYLTKLLEFISSLKDNKDILKKIFLFYDLNFELFYENQIVFESNLNSLVDYAKDFDFIRDKTKYGNNYVDSVCKEIEFSITGQKYLFLNSLKEALTMSLVNEPFHFNVFMDNRTRLYIGNNNFTPYSSSMYSNLLCLTKLPKISSKTYEKAKTLFKEIKDYDNFFSKSLKNDFLETEIIFNKHTIEIFYKENKEICEEFDFNNLDVTKEISIVDFSKIFNNMNRKDIFNKYAWFLDYQRLIENSDNLKDFEFNTFFSRDTSSSGIQIGGLLFNSAKLLKFSNFTGTEKSKGYKIIFEDYLKFANFVQHAINNENKIKATKKIKEMYPKVFRNYSEMKFFCICRNSNEIKFDSLMLDSKKGKLDILGMLYGMKKKGLKKNAKEFFKYHGLYKFFKPLWKEFCTKEENTSKKKKLVLFNENKKFLPSNQKRSPMLNIFTRLSFYLITNSDISDLFTKAEVFFELVCQIKELLKESIVVKNDNNKFNCTYFIKKIKRFDIYKVDEKMRILKRRTKKLVLNFLTDKFNYRQMTISIRSNFFQNLDACILHNFVLLCKKHKIPCIVRHDQFAIPYNFSFALLPLVAEAILIIDWKKQLLNFCEENNVLREKIYSFPEEEQQKFFSRKAKIQKLQELLKAKIEILHFDNYREKLTNFYFIKY